MRQLSTIIHSHSISLYIHFFIFLILLVILILIWDSSRNVDRFDRWNDRFQGRFRYSYDFLSRLWFSTCRRQIA